MNYLLFALFAVLAVVFAAVLFKIVLTLTGGADSSMKDLAAKLGLPTLGAGTEGGLFLLDVWKGRELNVQNIARTSGDRKVFFAALDIPVKALRSIRLTVTGVGWMTQAGIQLGQKPLATGDEAFDKQFIVKGSDPDLAAKLMDAEMREAFRKVWDERDVRGVLSLRDGRLHYEEPGKLRTSVQVRRFADLAELCHALAEKIDRMAPPEPEKPAKTEES
jgi:hypothetical protein